MGEGAPSKIRRKNIYITRSATTVPPAVREWSFLLSLLFFFSFFYLSSGGQGGKKAQLHHTSTHFHTCILYSTRSSTQGQLLHALPLPAPPAPTCCWSRRGPRSSCSGRHRHCAGLSSRSRHCCSTSPTMRLNAGPRTGPALQPIPILLQFEVRTPPAVMGNGVYKTRRDVRGEGGGRSDPTRPSQ